MGHPLRIVEGGVAQSRRRVDHSYGLRDLLSCVNGEVDEAQHFFSVLHANESVVTLQVVDGGRHAHVMLEVLEHLRFHTVAVCLHLLYGRLDYALVFASLLLTDALHRIVAAFHRGLRVALLSPCLLARSCALLACDVVGRHSLGHCLAQLSRKRGNLFSVHAQTLQSRARRVSQRSHYSPRAFLAAEAGSPSG